jgi:hypothetical protein
MHALNIRKVSRESIIELLRIVLMLMIIGLHLVISAVSNGCHFLLLYV